MSQSSSSKDAMRKPAGKELGPHLVGGKDAAPRKSPKDFRLSERRVIAATLWQHQSEEDAARAIREAGDVGVTARVVLTVGVLELKGRIEQLERAIQIRSAA